MARYVDGFLMPILKKNIQRYKRMATIASKVWMDHGALEYYESVGDDLSSEGMGPPFPQLTKAKAGETVVFSWIVYKSRKHRDQVNRKVMADPRLAAFMPDKLKDPPMDHRRMSYGGFEMLVDVPPRKKAPKKKAAGTKR